MFPEEYQTCFLLLPYIYCLYHYWQVRTSHIMKPWLFFCFYFGRDSGKSLPRQFWDWKIHLQKRSMLHSSICYLSTSCLWIHNLAELYSYLNRCKTISLPSFFFFLNLVFRHERLFLNENPARYSPFLFGELCKQNLLLSLPIWAFMYPLIIRTLWMSDKGR